MIDKVGPGELGPAQHSRYGPKYKTNLNQVAYLNGPFLCQQNFLFLLII